MAKIEPNPFAQFAFDRNNPETKMSVNGCTVTLNMPEALKSKRVGDGQEIAHRLPPYAPRVAYAVEDYPGCPENWLRGSGTAASYFVPVLPEHGLWLDFNGNSSHTHHVAVLISIQGINPITGQKTAAMVLEQYKNDCPVHLQPFGQDRMCQSCGYKWDAQNYLAGNATPSGWFWLDGFRAQDGQVRQYVFTEEAALGVAAQLIGEERVFAIGIAFFLSKERKPALTRQPFIGMDTAIIGDHTALPSIHLAWSYRSSYGLSSRIVGSSMLSMRQVAPRLEIAAGAKINQRIYPDPESLDFWQEEPVGTIYINYVDSITAEEIIKLGKRDMTAGGEGFMQDLTKGQN